MRLLLPLLLLSPATLSAAPFTGPWNLADLDKAPAVEWVDAAGPLRKLYYAGEPLAGKPTRVFAYYAEPEKIDGKLPAMVLVHGGGGTAFAEWATLWAKRGYVAIAMDLGGCGPGQQRLPDGAPPQDDGSKFGEKPRELKEMWTYHAVADVIRAVSLLRSLPNVDPDRIGITGISWGGYLTSIVAGLDQRLKVAVPVYGCGFLDANSVWLDRFVKMTPEWKKEWVASFDPRQYVGQATMPVLWVNGTNDFAYPLDSYQQTYRLTKDRTLCVTVNMPHGHQQGWAPKEIGLFVDAVLKKGEPLVKLDIEPKVRDGKIDLWIRRQPDRGGKKVALHWTADLDQPWQKRKWQTEECKWTSGKLDYYSAARPTEKKIVYFFTATDDRGAVVSTEHYTLE